MPVTAWSRASVMHRQRRRRVRSLAQSAAVGSARAQPASVAIVAPPRRSGCAAGRPQALRQYDRGRRSRLPRHRHPGAGKTTFALALARLLLARKRGRPGRSSSARPTTCAPSGPRRPNGSAWRSTRPCPTPSARCGPASTATSRPTRRSRRSRCCMRPARPPQRSLVILDEVHHAGDGLSWGEAVAEAFEQAERRVCLTGTPFRTRADERIPFVRYDAAVRRRARQPGRLHLQLPAGAGRRRRASGRLRRVYRHVALAQQRRRGHRRVAVRSRHQVDRGRGLAHRAQPARAVGAARHRRDGRADHPAARVGHAGRGRACCWPATRPMRTPTPRSSSGSPGSRPS